MKCSGEPALFAIEIEMLKRDEEEKQLAHYIVQYFMRRHRILAAVLSDSTRAHSSFRSHLDRTSLSIQPWGVRHPTLKANQSCDLAPAIYRVIPYISMGSATEQTQSNFQLGRKKKTRGKATIAIATKGCCVYFYLSVSTLLWQKAK
jgi:hypothetical protein